MVSMSGHRVWLRLALSAGFVLALALPARAQSSISFSGGTSIDPGQAYAGVAWESPDLGGRFRLRPGIDGVVLAYGGHRGTFLPQVWEQLPEPAEFLAQLKRNAGLPVDFWAEDVRLSRYTVSKWQEGKP